MTSDAPSHRPEPGTRLLFRWRKWDGMPHWEHECVYLGSDEHGDWFGQEAGWRSIRPGRDMAVRSRNVTLVPPTGDFAYTWNSPPQQTRIYIDLAWDIRWVQDEQGDAAPEGIDMDLDVVRREPEHAYVDREGVERQPGDVYIEDRDEWDLHRVRYGYPADIVTHLDALAVDLEARVRASEAPFDQATAEHWLGVLDAFDLG